MRVLATTHPGSGHLHPLVPLLRALEEQGHQVRVATTASFVPAVEAAGFDAVGVGPDWLESNATETLPGFLSLDAGGQMRRFADLAVESGRDVVDACRAFGADVVVRESTEYGGWVAAQRLDLPHVECGIIAALGGEIVRRLAGDALDRLLDAYGLPPDPRLERLSPFLYADFLPHSFTPAWLAPPSSRRNYHAAPYAGSGEALPPHLGPQRGLGLPLVYVTLGTVFNRAPEVFRLVAEALREEQVEVLMTVGRSLDPASLGPQPENVHVTSYVPVTELLPHCSTVVCHAGSNTILAAVDHGVPLVCLPFSADQPLNAVTCVGLGIARSLANDQPAGATFPLTRPERLTPVQVREAVLAVLTDPSYRSAVSVLQTELHASAPVAQAARAVHSIVTGRPVS